MNAKSALAKIKSAKGKIPKKGTQEYEIFIYFIQIIEGATAVLFTRLGVNMAAREPLMKEILTWAISIILFVPCFFKFPGVEHVKAIAYGVFMEAINRTIMKRLEKTETFGKLLAGDEIAVSETEMEALVEKRALEIAEANKSYPVQGDEVEDTYPQYTQGEEEESEEETTMQGEDKPIEGEETEVHDRIIPMRI